MKMKPNEPQRKTPIQIANEKWLKRKNPIGISRKFRGQAWRTKAVNFRCYKCTLQELGDILE
jgi:hypothetical protein